MYKTIIDNMNLTQIANSGQAFRMNCLSEDKYSILAGGRCLNVSQKGKEFTFSCTEQEFKDFWFNYFDLSRNYGELLKKIDVKDDFLVRASEYGNGIRILKQDLWEMIITFIISQQKRIPNIKSCVERLCKRYCDGYAFPTPEQIAVKGMEGLSGLSLGYRERYLYETSCMVCEGKIDLEELKTCGYESARDKLKTLSGIGDKVANCICLFGLSYVDAFPIDTHIKSILYREYYKDKQKPQDKLGSREFEELVSKNFARYAGFRGIVQQWIFAYELKELA